jgi:CheY-like chemotaxis protein
MTAQKKVLIVDDDQFLLNMYSLKFKNAGFDVDAVFSGQAALEKLRTDSPPEAIVMDVVMPVMDGFELLENIKKEKLAERAAIILLTNQGQNSDIDKGAKLGADGYIVKASTIPSEVVKEVEHIIETKRQQ